MTCLRLPKWHVLDSSNDLFRRLHEERGAWEDCFPSSPWWLRSGHCAPIHFEADFHAVQRASRQRLQMIVFTPLQSFLSFKSVFSVAWWRDEWLAKLHFHPVCLISWEDTLEWPAHLCVVGEEDSGVDLTVLRSFYAESGPGGNAAWLYIYIYSCHSLTLPRTLRHLLWPLFLEHRNAYIRSIECSARINPAVLSVVLHNVKIEPPAAASTAEDRGVYQSRGALRQTAVTRFPDPEHKASVSSPLTQGRRWTDLFAGRLSLSLYLCQ